jgi:hypothetical protein
MREVVKNALIGTFGPARANRVIDIYRAHGAWLYWDHLRGAVRDYRSDERGRRSRAALLAMRDKFRGERCFILGNGPSVAEMDLTRLRNEYTFGLNRGYLLFDRIGRPTTFLVAVNEHVVEQFGSELLNAGSRLFVSWHTRHHLPANADATYVMGSYGPRFCTNVAIQGAWEGATVTFVAMQLAYHMGFDEVVLIGVDHSFATSGAPHALVTSTGEDRNHFDPNYFGPGTRWQLPDLETSEQAYVLARRQFEARGRQILDATVHGRLDVFPKADFSSLTAHGKSAFGARVPDHSKR